MSIEALVSVDASNLGSVQLYNHMLFFIAYFALHFPVDTIGVLIPALSTFQDVWSEFVLLALESCPACAVDPSVCFQLYTYIVPALGAKVYAQDPFWPLRVINRPRLG